MDTSIALARDQDKKKTDQRRNRERLHETLPLGGKICRLNRPHTETDAWANIRVTPRLRSIFLISRSTLVAGRRLPCEFYISSTSSTSSRIAPFGLAFLLPNLPFMFSSTWKDAILRGFCAGPRGGTTTSTNAL